MIIKSKEDTDVMMTEAESISNSIALNKSQKKERGGGGGGGGGEN